MQSPEITVRSRYWRPVRWFALFSVFAFMPGFAPYSLLFLLFLMFLMPVPSTIWSQP